jgi:hypothetical protein
MTKGHLSPRERLDAVFALETPDRTPLLGGWIAAPGHVAELAGVDLDAYWGDPRAVSVEAYRRLGTDGLIDIFVPRSRKDFRCVDNESYAKADQGQSLEESLAAIDALPAPERIAEEFDVEKEYAAFRDGLVAARAACDPMVWMPAQWGAAAKVGWYGDFGYENFFVIVAAHERHARKLIEVGGERGRLRCELVARAVREGLYPRAMLFGEDICTQRGPMISPATLEKHYLPALKRGLAPLLDAGCRPVWHCDGDVRPLLPLLVEAGVQGFQGFQPECGLTVDTMAAVRTRDGEPPVIFGPLAVTTELPVCTPDEIRAKVRHAIDVCRANGAGLCLFTGNTVNPDVPLANILAMSEAVRDA